MEEFPSAQAVVVNGGSEGSVGGGGGAFPCDCRSLLTPQYIHETAKKLGIIKIIGGHEDHY